MDEMLVVGACANLETAGILVKARQGDAEAFCRLLEPLETRLLRQAAALCGNASAAEDLVAETMAEGWTSLARYDESRSRLSTWLYAILLHRYQKSIRAARSRPVPLHRLSFADVDEQRRAQESEPSPEDSPEQAAARKEFALEMQRAVASLPQRHREVVLLRFFEEASLEEISSVLGCSIGTVKSRLHHALDKLRRMQITLNLCKGNRDTSI